MEVQKRRRFSDEFKEDVVNMILTGNKSVKELSKELGIKDTVIYRWYHKYRNTDKKEEDLVAEKEVRELRAKLAVVTEERDILKKALNIFSKQGV